MLRSRGGQTIQCGFRFDRPVSELLLLARGTIGVRETRRFAGYS